MIRLRSSLRRGMSRAFLYELSLKIVARRSIYWSESSLWFQEAGFDTVVQRDYAPHDEVHPQPGFVARRYGPVRVAQAAYGSQRPQIERGREPGDQVPAGGNSRGARARMGGGR
jgi:hypothetical protein